MGLFVYAHNNRVLGRVQIQRHHVCGLRAELGIGGDTPTAAPLELDAAAAQDAPDLVGADIAQRVSQQRAVPLPVTRRRWFIEQRQNTVFGLTIIGARLAGARNVVVQRICPRRSVDHGTAMGQCDRRTRDTG